MLCRLALPTTKGLSISSKVAGKSKVSGTTDGLQRAPATRTYGSIKSPCIGLPILLLRPPKRRKRNPLTVNQRAQAKCDPEASRPIHQFLWQLHNERDRIINEHTDGTSPAAFSLDINDTAYESIKSTWVRRGIWDIKWGILPGMSWKHEWPLPWQTWAAPGPAVAPSYSTGRKESTILLRSEDAKGSQVSILPAAAASTHLPEVLGNSEVEDVAYVADDCLPSPTQGSSFSALDGKAQDEAPTSKSQAPNLYSSYSGDYEHGNNSNSMGISRQKSTHPVSQTTALAKTSVIGRAAKSSAMSKAPANKPDTANTKNGCEEGVERPLFGWTLPVEGDSLAVAGYAPHQEAAIKPRRQARITSCCWSAICQSGLEASWSSAACVSASASGSYSGG